MAPVHWPDVDLVVFDLDGTLYDQTRLRARMAIELAMASLQAGDMRTIRILRAYRLSRERLADAGADDVLHRPILETAQSYGLDPDDVRAVVHDWIETRPLRHLLAHRSAGIEELFAALRRSGRGIAVLSDHRVDRKLGALGLQVDWTASAEDPGILRFKPDPKGLLSILSSAGVQPRRALMVGDRFDRDLAVAARAGVPAVIRSRRHDPRCPTFRTYRDRLFASVLEGEGGSHLAKDGRVANLAEVRHATT